MIPDPLFEQSALQVLCIATHLLTSDSGALLERHFSFGQHATVRTALPLVDGSLQCVTEQHALKRHPVLIVYQPCASAQSIAVFVVRRMRNQAVFRKATVCILH